MARAFADCQERAGSSLGAGNADASKGAGEVARSRQSSDLWRACRGLITTKYRHCKLRGARRADLAVARSLLSRGWQAG